MWHILRDDGDSDANEWADAFHGASTFLSMQVRYCETLSELEVHAQTARLVSGPRIQLPTHAPQPGTIGSRCKGVVRCAWIAKRGR